MMMDHGGGGSDADDAFKLKETYIAVLTNVLQSHRAPVAGALQRPFSILG